MQISQQGIDKDEQTRSDGSNEHELQNSIEPNAEERKVGSDAANRNRPPVPSTFRWFEFIY